MTVDFSIQNIIEVIAQVIFGGNVTACGIAIMVVVMLITMGIMAKIGTHPAYSLAVLIPLSLVFGYMGIISEGLSFLIVIISIVIIGVFGSKVALGGE